MNTMQVFAQVNWIAVVLGAAFSMLLGVLWYGPLFGKIWLRSIGKKADELSSNAGMYVFAFLGALVSAYVLAVLIGALGITVWWRGAVLGAIVSIGIGSMAALVNNIFHRIPALAWLLFALYQLVLNAAEGLVFAVWRL
jgi:mannitol-specific phosphotransferase system IIBC component